MSSAIDTYAYEREERELAEAEYQADREEMESGEYGPVMSRAEMAEFDALMAAHRAKLVAEDEARQRRLQAELAAARRQAPDGWQRLEADRATENREIRDNLIAHGWDGVSPLVWAGWPKQASVPDAATSVQPA